MEKEFVPYEQALALKELGFDEECLVLYDGRNSNEIYFNSVRDGSGDYRPFKSNDKLGWIGAPLYQQAFRWFREKHDLFGIVQGKGYNHRRYYMYTINGEWHPSQSTFDIYEEAELACLKKLIELVKNK